MNYGYNGYANPYGRNYGMPNYVQPQYAPQPQQMPPQQMAQPQPQQPMQYETPIQYVGYANLKEAEAHILFPNQKALFIDKANGMVYEKVCGIEGQSEIVVYKRVEDKADNTGVVAQKEQPTIDLSNYVTKGELGGFVSLKQYNELSNKIEQLQKQLGGRINGGTNKQQ